MTPRSRPPAALRDHVRKQDGGAAFLPDSRDRGAHVNDDLAENLAEAYLESATSGEEQGEERMNALVPEELGGPFIEETDLTIDDDGELPPFIEDEHFVEDKRQRRT